MTWTCCATAGWPRSSTLVRAPSTYGTFLRTFTFGHVRRLGALLARALAGLAAGIPRLLAGRRWPSSCGRHDPAGPRLREAGAATTTPAFRGVNAQIVALVRRGQAPRVESSPDAARGSLRSRRSGVRIPSGALCVETENSRSQPRVALGGRGCLHPRLGPPAECVVAVQDAARAWRAGASGVRSRPTSPALLPEASYHRAGPAFSTLIFPRVEGSGDALNTERLTGRDDRKAFAGQQH